MPGERAVACASISTRARRGIKEGLFIPAFLRLSTLYFDATRGMSWSHEPGNVIETHVHKMDLVDAYGVSAALAFILDSACQRAYKALS